MTESLAFLQTLHVVSAVDDPTIILRGERRYMSGTSDEFQVLTQLYRIAPEHVAKPLHLLHGQDNKVIGYQREEVIGKTLDEYLRENKYMLPVNIQQQVIQTLTLFHLHNLAHGDPTAKNILITSEGKVKFIDPVGYNPTTTNINEIQTLIDWDNEQLAMLMDAVDYYASHPEEIH